MSDLRGRSILVVGASSGMGRASAIAMTRAGAEVVYAARRTETLEDAIAEAGGGHAVRIDASDPASIAEGVAEAIDRLDGLDALLYTAGMSPLVSLKDLDAGQWHEIFAVNTFGPSLVISAALDRLNPEGVVAVVSSDSASQPRHSLVAYAASKAALEASMEDGAPNTWVASGSSRSSSGQQHRQGSATTSHRRSLPKCLTTGPGKDSRPACSTLTT